MILNEETFDILNFDVPDVANADIEVADIDATVPEAGPEVGVETLLMQAIKDIYGMIEGYNSLSIALTDIGNETAAVAIADIIRMEHSNIGALQDILKEISPNAEAVDINESLNENSAVQPLIHDGDWVVIYRPNDKRGKYYQLATAELYGTGPVNINDGNLIDVNNYTLAEADQVLTDWIVYVSENKNDARNWVLNTRFDAK